VNFGEYQSRALATKRDEPFDQHAEVGTLLAQYKEYPGGGSVSVGLRNQIAEELADILFYISNTATKFDLTLSQIAEASVEKNQNHPPRTRLPARLYDVDQPVEQQLPREFEYEFTVESVKGVCKVVVRDRATARAVGDPLTSNAYAEDGYRFHDVLHLGLAVRLGWSPVLRKLLRRRRQLANRGPALVDEVEDGGRAQVVEEAVVAAAFVYAAEHNFLLEADALDYELLRHIERLTANLEVSDREMGEWADALIDGFRVWRQLVANDGGIVRGDLTTGLLSYRTLEPITARG